MVTYLGDFPEDQSVFVALNTFDSNDPSASVTITNLADTDIHIHKNDGTTQHSSATDVDVQINFDSVTGNHMVEIRTTNAFFTTGADYFVRMEGTTVDAGTVNAWIAHFSIENRYHPITETQSGYLTAGVATATSLATAQLDLDTLTGTDGATLATAQGNYAPSKAGDAMSLTAGAITDASLAGNMEIVFETDFATNYNVTRQAWVTNYTDIIGTAPASQASVDTIDGIVDAILVDTTAGGAGPWTTGAGGTPPDLLQSTTIATLASQVSFTLTAGSADDNAYNDQVAIITDQATSTQKAVASISDYTGSTKTVTLAADPAIFTMATGDTIEIVAATGAAGSGATAAEVRIEMDANSTQLAAIVADTNELQTDWANAGRLDAILDARASQTSVDTISARIPAALVDGRMSSDAVAISGSTAAADLVQANIANLDQAVSLCSTLTAGDVNAQCSDVLKTDTIAEMVQGAPTTTPTFEEAVMYVYMALVHGVDITATSKDFKNNAGTVIWKKALSDDGTTYTEAESASGP